jgi:hypothetical protein
MRLPPPSRCIHIALLFVSHFFLGTFVAAWGSYQYEQSRWSSSFNQEQGKLLLGLRVTQLASKGLVRNTPDSLERDLDRLEVIRRRAAQEVQAIVALRIASGRALLARHYRDANDPTAAIAQDEAARSLLRDLGWKDTSEATLSELAERRLKAVGSREVR